MLEPRPYVVRLVTAMIRAEKGHEVDQHDSDVAQRIIARLHRELGKLIGPAGFDVLVARSLVLARRAYPILAGVTAGPEGTIAGMNDGAHDAVDMRDGARALVAHLMELLVKMVGEDLATRLVLTVWPAMEEVPER